MGRYTLLSHGYLAKFSILYPSFTGRWDGSASVRDSGMVMAIGRKYLKYLGSRDDIRISHFIDVYDDKKLVS